MNASIVSNVSIFIIFFLSAVNTFAILGGVDVRPTDFIASSTVLIMVKNKGTTDTCSGSIIARDIVVTAGHCIPADVSQIRVAFAVAGAEVGDANSTGAIGAIANPDYKDIPDVKDPDEKNAAEDTDESDIGLIRIAGHLPAGYEAAELMADSSSLPYGGWAMVAGYGVSAARCLCRLDCKNGSPVAQYPAPTAIDSALVPRLNIYAR
jgi:hypothetical protein